MYRSPQTHSKKKGTKITVTGCHSRLATQLRRAAVQTLALENHSGEVEIRVLDSCGMDRLHREWLGIRGATDVLTFDLRERPKRGTVDGQIAVCKSVARKKAKELGHDWKLELALYVIHGCLHLCGYDDLTAAQFQRIHKREDEILAALGLEPVFQSKIQIKDPRKRGGKSPRRHQKSKI